MLLIGNYVWRVLADSNRQRNARMGCETHPSSGKCGEHASTNCRVVSFAESPSSKNRIPSGAVVNRKRDVSGADHNTPRGGNAVGSREEGSALRGMGASPLIKGG